MKAKAMYQGTNQPMKLLGMSAWNLRVAGCHVTTWTLSTVVQNQPLLCRITQQIHQTAVDLVSNCPIYCQHHDLQNRNKAMDHVFLPVPWQLQWWKRNRGRKKKRKKPRSSARENYRQRNCREKKKAEDRKIKEAERKKKAEERELEKKRKA